MRIVVFVLTLLISTSVLSEDCVQLLLKFRDPEIIKMERQIEMLKERYHSLDVLWDQLDKQSMVSRQIETAAEMEQVLKQIDKIKEQIVYPEEVLPGKEALLNRIRALEAEARASE